MSSPSPTPPDRDWPAEVTARIESVVGLVRDKTTVPTIGAVQAVVFGMILGVVGAVIVIMIVIMGVRILNVYLPFHPLGRRVWITDLLASAIFLGAGAFCWRKRRPRSASSR